MESDKFIKTEVIDLGAVVEETKGPPAPNEDTVGGISLAGGISEE